MGNPTGSFILPDVPPLNHAEHPDLFLEALSIAAAYGNDSLAKRFPMGVYPHLSGYTGRGWLIGFDEACYYWERHGIRNPHPEFAVSGIDANLRHHETLREAIAYLGYTPQFLWNGESRYVVDRGLAPAFLAAAETAARMEIRRYVTDCLTQRHKPVVCFLHSPHIPMVEAALLTGFESEGAVVTGRSPCYEASTGSAPENGCFRLADWEGEVVLIAGLSKGAPIEPEHHPCYRAIENALRYSESYTEGTKHYGLSAYDAWQAALLDEAGTTTGDDQVVSRRLLYHSSVAGQIACQKAFTAFPDYWQAVPSMGIISGLLQRAVAGPQIIHGLMWDVWQVIGGYWRGIEAGDTEYRQQWANHEEISRFRDRAVRERAAAVIRRAKRTDEQAIEELREAKADWDRCRGQGAAHPCPCRDVPCTRV